MAGSRTLKLSILADVDDLRKKLDTADNEVQGFGDKLGKWSKVAGAAFVAAGAAAAAYAGKLAIDGVKAAIEDEAAQLKLATTLKNVTGATNAQIKATEDYITKTSLAFNVTDDELRPSLDRLTRATKDVTEAQRLQSLALDVAAGTGKSLTAVSEALSKAYDGNFGALKKLGVSIDETVIKNKDFTAATQILSDTFKDQASIQADTFEGKLGRLKIAFDEGKETVGAFILDAITPLIEILVNKVIPAIQDFTSNIGEKLQPVIRIFRPILDGLKSAFDSVKGSLEDNNEKLQPFYDFVKGIAAFVVKYLAPAIGETLGAAFKILGKVLDTIIDQFARVVSFLTSVFNRIKAIIDFLKNNPVTQFFTGSSDNGSSGSSVVNASYTVPAISAVESERERGLFQGGTIINVTGAIDPESVARQINDILTQSAARGGGASNLVYA